VPGLRAPEALTTADIRGPEAAAPPRGLAVGVAAGSAAMVCVGGSVAVSSVLAGAPVYTAEGVRYGIACLLLVALSRLTGHHLAWPRKSEWLWLSGIGVTGLVVFNLALVEGSRHAEPAVLGVAVACVPAVLALAGPLLEGTRPHTAAVAAALVVTAGAGLVQGLGRTDAIGVAWAVAVFGCEAAFTLLAIPVLGRHGPWGVSVHATWLATVMFAVLGIVHEGPAAITKLTRADWLAVGYLAVAVTAAAFVLWYSSVRRLGASRAGLLTGIAPVAAAVSGVLLGGPAPRPLVWAGIAVVAVGLALGFRKGRTLCTFSTRPRSGGISRPWSPASCTPKASPPTPPPARTT
jgi:drug/metabolite transporter (DMT)-like permease